MELCLRVIFTVIDGILGGSQEHIYGAGVGCNRTEVEFVKLNIVSLQRHHGNMVISLAGRITNLHTTIP